MGALGSGSGLLGLAFGGTGGLLERGWPSAGDPTAVALFITENRAAILGQSMLCLLGWAVNLWFLGTLRSHLVRAEGGTGRLSSVTFGAGIAWVGIGMLAQAFQMGVTMGVTGGVQPAMLMTMAATFGIANLPAAVVLAAAGVVALRYRAFPARLGWVSFAAAASQVLLWAGTVVSSGPLSPTGWLTYALYPPLAVWVIAEVIVMISRTGSSPTEASTRV